MQKVYCFNESVNRVCKFFDNMKMTDEIENVEPTEDQEEVADDMNIDNIVIHCALKGDIERLVKCYEDPEDLYKETVGELINERDDEGKCSLDLAAALGRVEIIKELINRGAEISNATATGYSALHHAAAWGKIECLKALIDQGGDLQLKTQHGERPRETAARYCQAECVDFLDWAEAKQVLSQAISNMRETMADPEKVQGRLGREDKTLVTNTCNEKQDWLDNTVEATTQDFIMQKQQFDETLEPIWVKLTEPLPEKPDKK